MQKLPSIDDLKILRKRVLDDADEGKPRIVMCAGTACQASGANEMIRAAKRHILENGLIDRIGLRITGCHGFCEMGPFVLARPQEAFYPRISADDLPRIIDAVLADEYAEELLYRDPLTGQVFHRCEEIPFFKNKATWIGIAVTGRANLKRPASI